MVEFYMQNEFSAVFCSLSTGRWIKPLFCSKIVIFPCLTSQIYLQDNKGCVDKKPCSQCLTCWHSFSGSRSITKIAMKSQYIHSRVIQFWHDFLQICLPTVFGERALLLYILKLLGCPKQGPLSFQDKVCPAYLTKKIPFTVVHMVYIRTIFASCKFLDEYRVYLNKVHQNIICTSYKRYSAFPHNFQNRIPWYSMTFPWLFPWFFHDICYTFSMRV